MPLVEDHKTDCIHASEMDGRGEQGRRGPHYIQTMWWDEYDLCMLKEDADDLATFCIVCLREGMGKGLFPPNYGLGSLIRTKHIYTQIEYKLYFYNHYTPSTSWHL